MSTFRYRYEGIDAETLDNTIESGAGATLTFLTNPPWAEVTLVDDTLEDDLDEVMSEFGFVPDTTGPTVLVTGTSSYTVGVESNVLVDASGGNVMVTLADASTRVGERIFIKKVDSSANTVTVIGSGGDTVEGSVSQVLSLENDVIVVVPNTTGSNWVQQNRARAQDISFDDTGVGTGADNVQDAIGVAVASSTIRAFTAGATITVNDLVVLNALGRVIPASSSIAGGNWDVIGVAQASVVSGATVNVIVGDGQLAAMRFASAPAAAANGSRVFLSASSGFATLTPPSVGSGRVCFSVGVLQGADGASTSPDVAFRARHVAELP